jgi:ribonuclease HI
MTWYVVFKGYKTGVFSSWRECHSSVNGFKGACSKGYQTEGEARAAYHSEKGDPRCDQQVKGDDKVTIKQDVHPRCDPSCCFFKNVIIVLQFVVILVLLYKLR